MEDFSDSLMDPVNSEVKEAVCGKLSVKQILSSLILPIMAQVGACDILHDNLVASGVSLKVKPVDCIRVYSFAKTVQTALIYTSYSEALPINELTCSSYVVACNETRRTIL